MSCVNFTNDIKDAKKIIVHSYCKPYSYYNITALWKSSVEFDVLSSLVIGDWCSKIEHLWFERWIKGTEWSLKFYDAWIWLDYGFQQYWLKPLSKYISE